VEAIKIVVTDYIEPDLEWEKEQLSRFEHVAFSYHQLKRAPREELLEAIRDADVILVNMTAMTADIIQQLEKCQLIIRHGVGYDNVDVPAATAKGIRVAYEPDYCTDEVAEHAISLMLAAWRKVTIGRQVLEDSSRTGIWDFEPIYPIDTLKGKTLGIVGCGRIGSTVLARLQSFGFKFLVCDPYLSAKRREGLGVPLVDLDTLLRDSDIVTLHPTLNQETHHLIGAAQLRLMKSTAYLINSARGGLVDTDALAQALNEGGIAGAAIDVYVKEPPDPDFPLFACKNALLAPHLGWYSEEANWGIREKVLEDFVRFIEERPPRFLINKELAQEG
jgi:D-3-phosphoglycerate dehydrogenase / 2-oxoglutarate reductase